ncbi:hypothetical protein MPER_07552 [Moniliophthora perniciosa FA553]|nr:hypothetical protein MPER_07552 [Moniliophthora perniciosa FA553]
MSSSVREREHDDEDLQRDSKRQKINEQATETVTITEESLLDESLAHEHVLPPSHALLGVPLPVAEQGRPLNFLESDVGISEYVGKGVSRIDGIIKQRFTDFLVYEVDLDSNVIHLKSLAKPDSSKKNITEADAAEDTPPTQQGQDEPTQDVQSEEKQKEGDQSAEVLTTEAIPTVSISEEAQQSTAAPKTQGTLAISFTTHSHRSSPNLQ